MHPVLISLGSFSVSSFGFFLALSFLLALFCIWRLSRVYDIDEEKTLDISLLTFFGGLVGARILFGLLNLSVLNDLSKFILINRFPGLSFWGGVLGGGVVLYFLTSKLKISFWQMADFLMVGVFAGGILGSFGCLLGSCHPGLPSLLPFSVTQIGLVGKRFPIQLIESGTYFLAFIYIWRICLRFHFNGKVISMGLVLLGLINFFLDFFRADVTTIVWLLSINKIFSLLATVSGVVVFYYQGKRSVRADLSNVMETLTDRSKRRIYLLKIKKSWYNLSVNWRFNLNRSYGLVIGKLKGLLRNKNVKLGPPRF